MAIVNEVIVGSNDKDILTNNKKGLTFMSGFKGDDTYVIENISKSFTEIDDSGTDEWDGSKIFGDDTIQIKNVKANDLTLFFDVSLAPDIEASAPADELYIVKKSAISSVVKQVTKFEETWAKYDEIYPGLSEDERAYLAMQKAAPQSGAVLIPYHFGDVNNGGSQMSASAIEKIQVVDGKTGITKTLELSEYIAEVKEEVVELLQEVKGLGLRNYFDEPILSAFQLVNSKHTKYKNKLFNIYKSEEFDITIEGTSGRDNFVGEDCDNTFVFREGSGHDTITSSKGDDDTLRFEGINEVEYRHNKNDLIIYYGSDNSVTIKNYLKNPLKSPIEYIELGNSSKTHLYNGIEIDVYGTGKKSIAGTKLEDNIYGTDVAETIKASDSDDDITANGGDDKLYGGSGENDFYFSADDGNDVVYYDKNAQDTLNFVDVSLGDLHIEKGKYNGIKIVTTNGNSVELADYLKKGKTSVTKIYTGGDDTTTTLQNFLQGKYLIQNGDEKNNKLTGTNFADELHGNGGNDTLYGGAGNDVLYGEAGNDTITGGAGINTINYNIGNGQDVINLTKGETLNLNILDELNNNISNENLVFAPAKNKKDLEITIDDNNNSKITIKNYYGKDTGATVLINGIDYTLQEYHKFDTDSSYFVKNSKYNGSALADYVNASELQEPKNIKKNTGVTINANSGDDYIIGSEFKDTIKCGNGVDRVEAGAEADIIYGENGVDYIYGDAGNDQLYGGKDTDYLHGGDDSDTIKGGDGDDYIYGDAGNDKLYGEGGVNTFYFNNGDGNDTIYMGKDIDKIYLETEQDNAPTYNRSGNNLIINYGDDDSITIANYFKSKNPSIEAVNYKIYDEEEDGYVNKTDNLNDSIIIKGQPDYTYGYKTYYYEGNEKNNLIYANSKADEIDTGDGNNTVYINSKVEAGVHGGSGDDTYHVNSLKSYVWLNDADGTDKLVINEKASNINVIFEVNTTGGPIMDPYSSMLVLNDSAYNKHKKINFKIDPENINSGIQVADGDSSIEYIYSKDNKMIDIAQLKGQVEGWLSENGYTSAMQVLDYEKTDGDIEILLGIYQDAWQDVVV